MHRDEVELSSTRTQLSGRLIARQQHPAQPHRAVLTHTVLGTGGEVAQKMQVKSSRTRTPRIWPTSSSGRLQALCGWVGMKLQERDHSVELSGIMRRERCRGNGSVCTGRDSEVPWGLSLSRCGRNLSLPVSPPVLLACPPLPPPSAV